MNADQISIATPVAMFRVPGAIPDPNNRSAYEVLGGNRGFIFIVELHVP